MGFIDLLKPSRARFAGDPESDDDSKTSFLHDRALRRSADHGKIIAASRSFYWTMYCFLALSIVLLLVTVFQGRENRERTELWSQDILGKGNPKPHRFVNGYNHSARDSPEVRALYSKYLLGKAPLDVGIPVGDPAKYGLRPGYPTKKDKSVEAYIPSFIHQFHCLILFREAWWDLRDKYENRVSARDDDLPDEKPETQAENWKHVEHSTDYLRQTIECNADTTLEAPAEHEDGQRSNTDGMDVWRKCWDMNSVWERYMEFKVGFNMVRAHSDQRNGQ